MELSGLMKLRIAAAIITGVFLIGILAWPLATPSGPLSTVRAGDLSLGGGLIW